MRKVFAIALCTLFLEAAAALDNLAILPFTGGEGEEGETIAELFSFEPELTAVFKPVPRTSINRAIGSEQRFQLASGMTDPDTAAALGRQVGAQYVVSGSITAVGKQKVLIIGILKIDDLRQIAGDIQSYTQIEEIQDRLPDMARNMVAAARKDASRLPRLAITPVELSGGADPGAADALARVLAGHIIRNGVYAVYPRTASLGQVMEEYANQLNGDTADEHLPDLGRGANPELVLSVTARRLGSRNMFNAAIINLESGEQEAGASANYRSLEDGMSAVETLAAALSGKPRAPAASAAPSAPRILPGDLAEVFGVKGVTAAFNAVHAFLQTCNSPSAAGRRERIAQRIMLGDWIDLPRLTVQGDAGGGAINTDNTDLGGNGKLLRLIVVGLDSFAATNKDAPAHIVFQFQNIPGTHRMNPSNTNAGGYKASELRRYLTDSFLRGLLAAGVPEGVLYAPVRYIANNGGQGATAADALRDWLWLPSERELFGRNGGSNTTWETGANQARLEYYENDSRRVKYNANGAMWWWEASPSTSAGSAANFCYSHDGGNTYTNVARGVGGCAPAFCVR
ncbi:MAG: penicillin-binding protein activator LpoB [Treponema sp.]|jgi:hypothetical protein|nr:penicillin-binding protein activator LpoB [Treponema sp.]